MGLYIGVAAVQRNFVADYVYLFKLPRWANLFNKYKQHRTAGPASTVRSTTMAMVFLVPTQTPMLEIATGGGGGVLCTCK